MTLIFRRTTLDSAVTRHYLSPHDLLAAVKKLLVFKTSAKAAHVLDNIVDTLYQGRPYESIALYLAGGDEMVRQCFRGEAAAHSFALNAGNMSAVVPLKLSTRVVGILEIQGTHGNPVSPQDHAMLKQVAGMLARYLSGNQGKLLLRKARAKSHVVEAQIQPHKAPQPVRPEKRRAAAGEQSTR